MIGILDIQMGNLRSVSKAVYELGFDFVIIDSVKQFDDISHLILPGVGHFKAAMQALATHDFIEAIHQLVQSKRPFLGICLGMQLLATKGFEGGENQGLHLVAGEVKKFTQSELRVPHVGWNNVNFTQAHPVFADIKNNRDFYFVHSFHYEAQDNNNIYALTDYG